jgi:hypothetical protein
MARVDRVLLFVALALTAFGIFISIDLLHAVGAQPCPAPDCYPWGAEGPAAGHWAYQSKSNYLAAGFAELALPAAASLLILTAGGQALNWRRRGVAIALVGLAVLVILLS